MTPTSPDSRGVGWVTLAPNVEMNRAWLVNHTPRLFTAWEQTQSTQQRLRLAQLIQQVAAATESLSAEEDGMSEHQQEPWEEFVNVRIEWSETTRYSSDFYIDPYLSDTELREEIAMAMHSGQYQTRPVTDEDNRIVSITTLEGGVLDIDGDGRASVLERFISPEQPPHGAADYGDLADSIDLRLAESADWPALNAALQLAAADGYDVEGRLPTLAAQEPLPNQNPATELRYRLMADCDATLASPGAASTAQPASADSQPIARPADADYDLRPAFRDTPPPPR